MIKDIEAKTLLASHTKPDSWFGCKYNMNLYRGCQHQCIYCDSRSECYQIENFADILVKANAIDKLEEELSGKRKKGVICFGSMNDPYMPIEKERKLTRQALEVIQKYGFPVHMLTKSDLVVRDIDLLAEIATSYAAVSFTITTVDDDLARNVEPGASLPSKRLIAMKKLADGGIYTGVTMMPILPFIEDTNQNIEAVIRQSHKYGAKYILPWIGMTLRDRQRAYYYQKLDTLFPGVRRKYEQAFGERYECNSPRIGELMELTKRLCKELGIAMKMEKYKEEQGRLSI